MPNSISDLIKTYLAIHFEFYPTHATDAGYAGFDDKLPLFDLAAVAGVLKKFEVLQAQVQALSPQNKDEKIDRDLLLNKIKIEIFWLTTLPHHVINPAYHVSLVSNSLFALIMGMHRTDAEKVHALTHRLKAIPDFLLHAKTSLIEPVRLWTKIALKEIPGLYSYLTETIQPYLEKQKVIGVENLIKKATHAIFDYANHIEHRTDQSASFAIGTDNFSFLLKTFHGIEKTPAEIREIGFAQIDILQKQLNAQAEKIDPTKSWQELVDILKKNHPTEKNLFQAYQDKVNELKKFLIDHDILTLPKEESLFIMPTPDFLTNSIPYAAYSAPTMFATDNRGLFFVTPVAGQEEVLEEHCYASFPLTALHEGYPGHHLQFAIQKTLSSDMHKVYDVASYYEGWTLYCEEMMFREGFYDDGMRLYQLKDRLWRAARIVVDVSMQCFGMTDDEAVNFLVDQAKLSPQSARIDVNWYTQSPTIPMSYLIGMLEVDQIREDYLKTGKTLKEFHDAFLNCGAIPLKFVREILGGLKK